MTEAPHEEWEGGSLLEQCNSSRCAGIRGYWDLGFSSYPSG